MSRYLLPLAIFLALLAVLGAGLTLNPSLVPSPLVGKATPQFSLPRLRLPDRRLTREDLLGKVSLLNVWATWCVGCREEHGLLLGIAQQTGVPIYGLNYKDRREDALAWLGQFGDPYVASGFDADGRVGIDLGVYGLPETFIIDANGMIAYKHIGPITPDAWRTKILPVIQSLGKGTS